MREIEPDPGLSQFYSTHMTSVEDTIKVELELAHLTAGSVERIVNVEKIQFDFALDFHLPVEVDT